MSKRREPKVQPAKGEHPVLGLSRDAQRAFLRKLVERDDRQTGEASAPSPSGPPAAVARVEIRSREPNEPFVVEDDSSAAILNDLRSEEASIKIFVFDEDDAFAATMLSHLRGKGFDAERLPTDATALEYLRRTSGAMVVLLDPGDPGSHGYELRRGIATDPAFAGASVLLMSADAHIQDYSLVSRGATVLRKPFTMSQLDVRLSRLRSKK